MAPLLTLRAGSFSALDKLGVQNYTLLAIITQVDGRLVQKCKLGLGRLLVIKPIDLILIELID